MDIGIQQAAGRAIQNPLPTSWLGRADSSLLPTITDIPQLSTTNIKNLQSQLGYDLSGWDYTLVGPNNEVGRYQFSPLTLEQYGLLAVGSNAAYGADCINYKTCWRPIVIRKNSNSYANYIYNDLSLTDFVYNVASQEHLAYQVILDLYTQLKTIGAIQDADGADVVAGMIYVAWALGPIGASTWRYTGIGNGANAFNSGRYSVNVLSNPGAITTQFLSQTAELVHHVYVSGTNSIGAVATATAQVNGALQSKNVEAALQLATSQLSTATDFSLAATQVQTTTTQVSTDTQNAQSVPTTVVSKQPLQSATLNQLTTSRVMLAQATSGSVSTFATGSIGQPLQLPIGHLSIPGIATGLLSGIGNGQSIVGLAAAAISNPSAALKTVENMAISYATNTATAFSVGISNDLLSANISTAFGDSIN